ncbi:unnamed protein product [Anisakis simplex]|uniref:Ovule protein n=1 Tax=Anisakis simplex TaxID=6269 RepID=A0A0M3K6G0_ANISI|nr:unnamed protein product [Anisakis simplex]
MTAPFWVPQPLPFTIFCPPMPSLLLSPNMPTIFPPFTKPSQSITSKDTVSPHQTTPATKRLSKMFLVESLLPSVAEKQATPPPVSSLTSIVDYHFNHLTHHIITNGIFL